MLPNFGQTVWLFLEKKFNFDHPRHDSVSRQPRSKILLHTSHDSIVLHDTTMHIAVSTEYGTPYRSRYMGSVAGQSPPAFLSIVLREETRRATRSDLGIQHWLRRRCYVAATSLLPPGTARHRSAVRALELGNTPRAAYVGCTCHHVAGIAGTGVVLRIRCTSLLLFRFGCRRTPH